MARQSALRFGAKTDEMISLLRIVNLVRLGEATTRSQIGQVTGLGRGVVTQRVDQAMDLGYLEDGDLANPTGGRAPRTLRFRGDQGLIIVCALGALHIHVGTFTLTGDVLDDAHCDWDIVRGPAETLETAMSMIDKLLAKAGDTPVWGVGIGVPGPVNFATGSPVAPPMMPGWNGFDVRRPLEQHYDAPAWVDNDVNLLTLTERARRRDEHPDLIYIKVGSGIGAGLLSQGRIHRGAKGAAGDIGHERVPDADQVCRCGKVGCLEAVAGGWALVRDAGAAIAAGATGYLVQRTSAGETMTPELISLAAEEGDALAVSLVRKSALVVGQAIASLVNMFNPSVIVIGGAIAAGAGEIFLAEVRQRVYARSNPLATIDLSIVRSVGDIREPLRGGAEIVREQLFDATFARWFGLGRPTVDAVRPLRPQAPPRAGPTGTFEPRVN
ncbi:ROK family protein [Actinoplanes sp. NPDC051470]|uniref:ROK family protein n=1 Tax=Actinoplanes sp. NPDC051470 TaxID=3157224 RepID=UPI003435FB98